MEKKTDLRIQKTYLLLHNAFTALLEEKRFEDFTVNELCERAMIRRTTFYKHFADKYEYFSFYIREICAEFQQQLPPDVVADELNPYFQHMLKELLIFIRSHERLVRNILDSSMFPMLFDNLSQFIAEDVLRVLKQMDATKNLSAARLEGMAAFHSGGILNTLRMFLKRGTSVDEEEFLQIVSPFLSLQDLPRMNF